MTECNRDFIAKLCLIEEYAAVAGNEAQVGSVKNYLRQIELTATLLRARLEMEFVHVIATTPATPADYPDKDRLR